MTDKAQLIPRKSPPRAEICVKCGGKKDYEVKDGGCVCATATCSGNR